MYLQWQILLPNSDFLGVRKVWRSVEFMFSYVKTEGNIYYNNRVFGDALDWHFNPGHQ